MSSYLLFNDASYYPGKVVGKSGSSFQALSDSTITNIEIPPKYSDQDVTEIGYLAFDKTQIISFFIPKTIKLIGNCAFCATSKLKEVKFEKGSNLEKIEIELN